MNDDAIDWVALWDAIREYVILCGGDPRSTPDDQRSRDALARIEAVLSDPRPDPTPLLSEVKISGLWKEAKGDEFHAVMLRFARAVEQATIEHTLATAQPQTCNNCRHRWDRKGLCMQISFAEWDEGGGRPWSEPTVKPPWCPGWEPKT